MLSFKHEKDKEDYEAFVIDERIYNFLQALDKERTNYVVTSLIRTPQENEVVGGVENSYHLTGHAVDIREWNINSEQTARLLVIANEHNLKHIKSKAHHFQTKDKNFYPVKKKSNNQNTKTIIIISIAILLLIIFTTLTKKRK